MRNVRRTALIILRSPIWHSATFIFLFIALPCLGWPQPVRQPLQGVSVTILPKPVQLNGTTASETDCANRVDDDGNGLIDADDPHCYFSRQDAGEGCPTSKMLWTSTADGIYSIDMSTGAAAHFPLVAAFSYDDLSWSSDGALYGVTGTSIDRIDLSTGTTSVAGTVNGYLSNGMTSDDEGNLYLTSFDNDSRCYIITYNVDTRQTKVVFNLSDYSLLSAGDLCFLNGLLYVSCQYGKVAKVDLQQKKIETIQADIPEVSSSFGISTLGDGYLYLTDHISHIYRMDPATGKTTFFMQPTDQNGTEFLGFATYPDVCNAARNIPPPTDEAEECPVFVPNAFTPNSDGKNELFSISSECLLQGRIQIFNRWGGIVYSSDDLSRGWNGFRDGHLQPAGLYAYSIQYETQARRGKQIKTGVVYILR